MLQNIVVYFVSLSPSYTLCCIRMGQNSRSRREHKSTAAAVGALLVKTVGETGFDTSSNANPMVSTTMSQLLCLTPHSCYPQTQLQLVCHKTVWLVLTCFPIPINIQHQENFPVHKNLCVQFLHIGSKISSSCLHSTSFCILKNSQ